MQGFDKLLASDPTRLHAFLAQRARYLEMRLANPTLRLQGDMCLGPRVTVTVSNSVRTTLEKPESWFVEMSAYQADNPDKEVLEKDKTWQQIDGEWVQGVVPTVLPSGTVWDFVHSRLLIGVEQLALQGIQFDQPYVVTNNQAQDLAGNAFPATVIVALQMAMLCAMQYPSTMEDDAMDAVENMLKMIR